MSRYLVLIMIMLPRHAQECKKIFYLYDVSSNRGKWSTAQNSSAQKPVFQANLQRSLAVFETCTADMLG